MSESIITIPFEPRPWQRETHQAMTRFSVVVAHRRAGKTILAVNELIRGVLACDKPRPQGAYIAPQREQAKRNAWKELKHFTYKIPGIKVNESELRMEFPNGGSIYLLGTDNADAIRGMYFDMVVLDEVADMGGLHIWDEIIRPALSDRRGSAMFIGTPKGKNVFYDFFMRGKDSRYKDWMSLKWDVYSTDALHPDEIESEKREKTEEAFAQEYLCSFDAAIKDAFVSKQLQAAENDGRLGFVPHLADRPVITGWDLGLDGTTIWYAQREAGGGFNIIDVDILVDKDVREACVEVKSKPYVYEYHILPHDAKKRSYLDKEKTTEQTIKQITCNKVVIADKLSPIDWLPLVRNFIDKCRFDANHCSVGLDHLRMYRPTPASASTGIESLKILHDEYSHTGDAFRTLACGVKTRSATVARPYEKKVNSYYNPFKR